MNMPACISGAADCVLNFSASVAPQQAATVPIPITRTIVEQQAGDAGPVDAEREADDQQHGRRDSARRLAESTSPASSTGRGAGEASRRSNQPLLDVAGEVDAGRGAGEPGALHQADRDQEALVALGVEARQQR